MAASVERSGLSFNVSKDRIITKFPQAYHPDATPYQQINFHEKVRTACSQNKTGAVGVKVCKAVVLGDVAVGKTCLINRFCHDVFDRDYKATIGVDFEVEKFSILSVPFNLQMWDTAGQERFKCIASSYYRGANIVIVVFDMTEIDTLSHAKMWKDEACNSAANPLVFLVGAKKDLVSSSAYHDIESKAIEAAKDLGAEFWATSSKTGEYVKEFLFRVVALAFDSAVQRERETISSPTAQVGAESTFKIARDENLYEKKKSKLACCKS